MSGPVVFLVCAILALFFVLLIVVVLPRIGASPQAVSALLFGIAIGGAILTALLGLFLFWEQT